MQRLFALASRDISDDLEWPLEVTSVICAAEFLVSLGTEAQSGD